MIIEIASAWIVGSLITSFIASWWAGKHLTMNKELEVYEILPICIVVSILWPIVLCIICIMCSYWLLGKCSLRYYKKKLQKEKN